jgi:hypothetical protein
VRRAAVLSVSALALATAAPFAVAEDRPDLPAAGSPGMEIVAHIPGSGGTDLEFFSRAVADWENENGQEVPEETGKTRHFAVVGNQESNAKIVDITDPEHPFVASEIPCALSQGDIQINEERSLVVIANGTGSASPRCQYTDAATGTSKPMPPGAAIVDISDVYAPRVIGSAPAASGAHNVTLTPDGQHLYISTSEIAEAQSNVPIYSLADPKAPVQVGTFSAPGNSPHDIRFSDDGTRAYTAGVSTFRILNTEDPTKPTVISTFFPPGASIGHDVLVSADGAFLFAGDEGGGGLEYPCPGGAIHTYDIRNEALPVYLGQSYAGAGPVTNRDLLTPEAGAVGSCTSHVMALNPDGTSLTLGWYSAGSRVFDFSGLYAADGTPTPSPALAYGGLGVGLVETDWIRPDSGSTWSAKQYAEVPGYIFSDDLVHGFYVTKLPAQD